MSRAKVWLTAFVGVVAIVIGLLTIAPVSATIQVLCKGVSTAEVARCNPAYAKDMGKMHWRMYAGHNCTNFVAWQLGKNGVPEPTRLMGNARDWVANAKKEGYTVNTTPAPGSIGAWGSAKNHVTYVAEVGSNYIITHEDNYPGYYKNGLYQELKIYKGDSSYPTQFIHFRDLVTTSTPTVSGTPRVGSTLSAQAGSWKPSGVTLAYQWLRNGSSISGATGSSYELSADDVDANVAVKVTGTKSGYVPDSATSSATPAVSPGTISSVVAPAVVGKAQVGATLTAAPGTWQPSTAAHTYQWLRNGSVISGASRPTYALSGADANTRISVDVTASSPGYEPLTRRSGVTAVVAGSEQDDVPGAPANLRTTAQGVDSLTLTWDAVPGAPKYRVQISRSATMSASTYHAFDGTSGRISGLEPATTYYVRVWVVDEAVKTRLSPISAVVMSATSAPPSATDFSAPSGLAMASAAPDSLTLSWNAVDGAPMYRVQVSESATMSSSRYLAFPGTSGTISGLKPGTNYHLRIWVVDEPVRNRLSPISPTVRAATTDSGVSFATPTDLRQTGSTSSSATMSWTAVVGAPKYRVQVSESSTMSSSKYYAFTDTSGVIPSLKAGTTYYYRIWVVDAAVKERLSAISAVTEGATRSAEPPAAPANLRVTGRAVDSLSLAWDPVEDAPKYRVQISRSATMSGSTYHAFEGTSGTISGLDAATTYYFRVWVVDEMVTRRLGPISAVESTTTAAKPSVTDFAAPRGLALASASASSLTMSWNEVPGAPRYRIQVSESPTMTSSRYYAFDGASGSIPELKARTVYHLRIWVVDDAVRNRQSPISATVTASTTASGVKFAVPTGLRQSASTATSSTMSWIGVVGAPKYRVQVSASSTMSSSKYYAFTGTTGVIPSLKAGTKYHFRIWVVNEPVTQRLSDISSIVAASTAR